MATRDHEATALHQQATLDAVSVSTSLTRGQQELIQLLRKIRNKCDVYAYFSVPVDPVAMECPDYFDVVSRDDVMDLGTMETLIRGSQLRNLDDFEACIKRIIDCSRLYNTDMTNHVRIETENLADKYKTIVERSRRQIEQALRSGRPRVKKRNKDTQMSLKQQKKKQGSGKWMLIDDDDPGYGDSSSGDDDDEQSSASTCTHDGSSSCSASSNSVRSNCEEEHSMISEDEESSEAAACVRSSKRKRKRLIRLMDVQAEESQLYSRQKSNRDKFQHAKDLEQINKLRKEKESCLIMVAGMDTPIRVKLGECYTEGGKTMLRVNVFGDSGKQYFMTLAEIKSSIAKVEQMGFYEVDRFDGHKIVNGVSYIRVFWSNGTSTWQEMQQLRDDDPYGLASWAQAKGLAGNQDFQWIHELPDLKNDAPQYEVDSYDDYKIEDGILYVQVKWSNGGGLTWEPLNNLIDDDPEGLRKWLSENSMNNHPLVRQTDRVDKVDIRIDQSACASFVANDACCDQQATDAMSSARNSNELRRFMSSSSSERFGDGDGVDSYDCMDTGEKDPKHPWVANEQRVDQSEQFETQSGNFFPSSAASVDDCVRKKECVQEGEVKLPSTGIVSNGEYIIEGRGRTSTLRWCWVQW